MNGPTLAEQKMLVQQWAATGNELSEIRKQALRGMPYCWADVDALLSLGDSYDGPPRITSGLVEMQAWFMMAHPMGERRSIHVGDNI